MIRDPAANRAITLPVAERSVLVDGQTMEAQKKWRVPGYYLQYGQPEAVRLAYEAATGLPGEGKGFV